MIINPSTRRIKNESQRNRKTLAGLPPVQFPKKIRLGAYEMVLGRFYQDFGDKDLDSLTSDQILMFLNKLTKGNKQNTRSIRYSSLSAFFNFVKINIDSDFQNPCDKPILRKMFKVKPITCWDIIHKEVVDEIIFRTDKLRDRIIM